MAKDVFMPALGMAQETGLLLQWLKNEGDEVQQGEPIMEVETDKATVEIEAPASGILANVTAQAGDEIPVGQVIALILAPGEEAPATAAPTPAAAPPPTPPPAEPEPAADDRSEVLASPLAARMAAEHNVDLRQIKASGPRIQKEDVLAFLKGDQPVGPAVATSNGRVLASPKARRLAKENALELAAISGSGPDGAVLAADVMAAVEARAKAPVPVAAPTATPADGEALPVSRMWQVMAQRLTESWNSVPHFYLARDANATQLLAWWEGIKARGVEKSTLTDLLTKLVAAALRQHPRMNAKWENDTIVLNPDVNVGLAVAVEDGLLVPVIHQADQKGIAALAERRREIVGRARDGKLNLDDLQGGTFTISNLGMFGIDAFNAIVNPPQAGILAVGTIADRVVPLNGQPAVQPMMTLTLSADHRVVDGARAAQFLQTLVRYIEDPLAALD